MGLPEQTTPRGSPRRAGKAVTILLVGAAATGGAALFTHGCARYSRQSAEEDMAAAAIVEPGREYSNNHYIPGVGFYHALQGAWLPLRHNSYQEGRGYYHGGGWHSLPDSGTIARSLPGRGVIAAVNRQWKSANPAAAAALANNHRISRGGFGGGARSFFSGS